MSTVIIILLFLYSSYLTLEKYIVTGHFFRPRTSGKNTPETIKERSEQVAAEVSEEPAVFGPDNPRHPWTIPDRLSGREYNLPIMVLLLPGGTIFRPLKLPPSASGHNRKDIWRLPDKNFPPYKTTTRNFRQRHCHPAGRDNPCPVLMSYHSTGTTSLNAARCSATPNEKTRTGLRA